MGAWSMKSNGIKENVGMVGEKSVSPEYGEVQRDKGYTQVLRRFGLSIALTMLVNGLSSLTSSSAMAPPYPPGCKSDYPRYIADSRCNDFNNNEDCGWDGGDCCECDCHGNRCGVLGWDCQDPKSGCFESFPGGLNGTTLNRTTRSLATYSQLATATSDTCEEYKGNGACDEFNNKEDCSYDDGDCCECECKDGVLFSCGDEDGYDCRDPYAETCAPTPSPTAATPIPQLTPKPEVSTTNPTTAPTEDGLVSPAQTSSPMTLAPRAQAATTTPVPSTVTPVPPPTREPDIATLDPTMAPTKERSESPVEPPIPVSPAPRAHDETTTSAPTTAAPGYQLNPKHDVDTTNLTTASTEDGLVSPAQTSSPMTLAPRAQEATPTPVPSTATSVPPPTHEPDVATPDPTIAPTKDRSLSPAEPASPVTPAPRAFDETTTPAPTTAAPGPQLTPKRDVATTDPTTAPTEDGLVSSAQTSSPMTPATRAPEAPPTPVPSTSSPVPPPTPEPYVATPDPTMAPTKDRSVSPAETASPVTPAPRAHDETTAPAPTTAAPVPPPSAELDDGTPDPTMAPTKDNSVSPAQAPSPVTPATRSPELTPNPVLSIVAPIPPLTLEPDDATGDPTMAPTKERSESPVEPPNLLTPAPRTQEATPTPIPSTVTPVPPPTDEPDVATPDLTMAPSKDRSVSPAETASPVTSSPRAADETTTPAPITATLVPQLPPEPEDATPDPTMAPTKDNSVSPVEPPGPETPAPRIPDQTTTPAPTTVAHVTPPTLEPEDVTPDPTMAPTKDRSVLLTEAPSPETPVPRIPDETTTPAPTTVAHVTPPTLEPEDATPDPTMAPTKDNSVSSAETPSPETPAPRIADQTTTPAPTIVAHVTPPTIEPEDVTQDPTIAPTNDKPVSSALSPSPETPASSVPPTTPTPASTTVAPVPPLAPTPVVATSDPKAVPTIDKSVSTAPTASPETPAINTPEVTSFTASTTAAPVHPQTSPPALSDPILTMPPSNTTPSSIMVTMKPSTDKLTVAPTATPTATPTLNIQLKMTSATSSINAPMATSVDRSQVNHSPLTPGPALMHRVHTFQTPLPTAAAVTQPVTWTGSSPSAIASTKVPQAASYMVSDTTPDNAIDTSSGIASSTPNPIPSGTSLPISVLEIAGPTTPSLSSTSSTPPTTVSSMPTPMLHSGFYLLDTTGSPNPSIASATPTKLDTMSPTAVPVNGEFGPTWGPTGTWAPESSNGNPVDAWFATTTFMSQHVATEAVSIVAASGIVASILGAIMSREAGANALAATVAGTGQTLQPRGPAVGGMSIRKPAATLAFLLMAQLQFLATVSLVDYYTAENEPWIHTFGRHLRWINLWGLKKFTDDRTPGEHGRRRSLALSSTCNMKNTGSFASMGNLVLVVGILLCIFLLHLLILSGFEAYWHLEKRAKAEWEKALCRGITDNQLLAYVFREPARQRVYPVTDADLDMSFNPTIADVGTPISLSPPRGKPESHANSVYGNGSLEEKDDPDQEKGDLVGDLASREIVDPIIGCRDSNASAWFYVPHVELLFLLFAFEGFVAAQVYGIQQSGCLPVQIVAAVVLVLYPVLMFIGVCRTTMVRVCSNAIIEFRSLPEEDEDRGGCMSRSFFSWKTDHSLFSWGDKGQWYTVHTLDEGLWRERNWFRIGFAPIFTDFTQSGAFFIMTFLLEWIAFACIAVLIESGIVQLFLFSGIHAGAFIMLVIFKPFANKVMDVIASMVAFINAVSMAIMGASALAWGETTGMRIDVAVALLQLLVLLVLVIPIYVDLVAVVKAALVVPTVFTRNKTQPEDNQKETKEQNKRKFVRGFIMHTWGRTWYNILARNFSAYARDVREGIRSPRTSPAGVRSRTYLDPYPAQSAIKIQ